MQFPVLLALTLVAAFAAVVFLSARRRLSTWLLLGSVAFFVGGGVLWAHEPSHRHAPEVAAVALPPAARLLPSTEGAGNAYAGNESTGSETTRGVTLTFVAGETVQPAYTGSGPNHLPAIVVFALGGAAGLVGVVLKRRPRAAA